MKTAIEKISARAKQLQRKHPNSSWKSLIKKASQEYRAGKKMTVLRKPRKQKKVSGMRKKVRHEINEKAQGAGLSIATATHFIKKSYEDKLGRAEVQLFNATTRTAKKNIRKRIAEYKRKLRKLD